MNNNNNNRREENEPKRKSNQKRKRYEENKNQQNDGKKSRNRVRFNTSKYCSIHSASSHNNIECRDKKDGHKDEASFKNMMGGCTDFCQVCT